MIQQTSSRGIVFLLASSVAFGVGCDSGQTDTCEEVDRDTYTASAPLVVPDFDRIAVFEFQQEVRTFDDNRSCQRPAAESEISLRIRNVTPCTYSFDYTLSIFEGQVGTTVERSASVQPNAVDNQGVVITNSGARVDRSQITLSAENVVQQACL